MDFGQIFHNDQRTKLFAKALDKAKDLYVNNGMKKYVEGINL